MKSSDSHKNPYFCSRMNAAELLSFIDYTSLNASDTEERIDALCKIVLNKAPEIAAVCFYPQFIPLANKLLPKNIKRATVIDFPLGTASLEQKQKETKDALKAGADEIDLVMNRNLLDQEEMLIKEIQSIKAICGEKTLKVIIESGELKSLRQIKQASDMVIAAGADFIKTSSGKTPNGASLAAATIILDSIKASEKKTGIKISGGIRNPEQAFEYVKLFKNSLGEKEFNPNRFRIGASSLLDTILATLQA